MKSLKQIRQLRQQHCQCLSQVVIKFNVMGCFHTDTCNVTMFEFPVYPVSEARLLKMSQSFPDFNGMESVIQSVMKSVS